MKGSSMALVFVALSYLTIGANLDSLRKVVATSKSDSTKAKVFLEIGSSYKGVSMDSMEFYYTKAQNLATCTGCESIYAHCTQQLGMLKIIQKDTTGFQYYLKAIEIYREHQNLKKVAELYETLGQAYVHLDRPAMAKASFWKSIRVAKAINAQKQLSLSHSNLGYVFVRNSLYDSASFHMQKAFDLRKLIGEKESHGNLLNMGAVYFKTGNVERALEYYGLALTRSIEEKDRRVQAVCYQNIGAALTKTKKLEEAKRNLDSAFEIYKERNDSSAMATYYASIADIKIDQNDLDGALENYELAKAVFPDNGRKGRRLFVHLNLSRTYLALSANTNPELLKKTMDEGILAYQLALETNQTLSRLEAASILYKAHNELRNFKEAAEFAGITIQLQDSLYNKQRVDAIADVQEKYETEKKQLEIQLLNKENKINETALSESNERAKNQNIITIATVVGLVLTMVILVLITLQSRQRKKLNNQLSSQNTTITEQHQEKELLLKEIHHRVKNNLQVVSSLLDLQSKKVGEDEKAVLAEGQSRVRAMALIHEKLYQSKTVSEIDFDAYCKQLSQQIARLYAHGEKVDRQIDVGDIKLDIDTAVPVGLILNELVTNAYKYAFTKGGGRLRISAEKNEQNIYTLRIEDSGQGLPDGFDWRKSKSLGLRLVHRLARQLYGTAEYSKSDKSMFEITFKDTIERKAIA